LDEIAGVSGIGRATKEEILQDPQARHASSVVAFSFSYPHTLVS
jgi:hypothetical protein